MNPALLENMYFVYILKSQKRDFIYVGSTPDLDRRVSEHNDGKVFSTQAYKPLKLVYCEAFYDKSDAMARESMLKHHGSVIGHLKRRLSNSMAKVQASSLEEENFFMPVKAKRAG